MIVAARTHAGWVRPNNQDTLLLFGRLYGVADGMGGHNGGEVASSGAAAVIGDMLSGLEPNEKRLEAGIQAANRRLYEQQAQDAALSGMGTTVTVLWEGNEEVFVGHVGDSRAYLLRDGVFAQITQDHSVVAEMMRQGILTKEKAKKHPYRNVITRAVGTSSGIEVDVIRKD
jgi:protein phosphatase